MSVVLQSFNCSGMHQNQIQIILTTSARNRLLLLLVTSINLVLSTNSCNLAGMTSTALLAGEVSVS